MHQLFVRSRPAASCSSALAYIVPGNNTAMSICTLCRAYGIQIRTVSRTTCYLRLVASLVSAPACRSMSSDVSHLFRDGVEGVLMVDDFASQQDYCSGMTLVDFDGFHGTYKGEEVDQKE